MKLKKTQKPKAKDGPKNITLIVKLEKKVVGALVFYLLNKAFAFRFKEEEWD